MEHEIVFIVLISLIAGISWCISNSLVSIAKSLKTMADELGIVSSLLREDDHQTI